ncbi:hypothetical protein EST38_g4033 [Candolleomyces aberdarensis]|uniref:Uncharacterized protein n=1 Tax=Candolleomyces aberdarensis TaxID=2316362 RepID=A0A4Q2DP59_9AGAR|nr:hypothetical protein EST38_g4033 [Candolleomyces aberdarensis]
MIRGTNQLSEFHDLIRHSQSNSSRRTPEFFALHVKSLSITRDSSDPNLEETLAVLQACSNVEWLVLWGFNRNGERTAKNNLHTFMTSSAISPLRLSIMTALFPEDQIHFLLPIFQNATHLELVWFQMDSNTPKDDVKWNTLGLLKNLTHLSIYPGFSLGEGYSRLVGEIVSLCPESLRVFIIWVYNTSHYDERSPAYDDTRAISEGTVDMRTVSAYTGKHHPRMANYGFSRSLDEVLRDCAGIAVGEDMWTLAEDFIEARRRRRSTLQS